ncbi:MAG: hypothetical protein D6730_02600 [Bacteroidetes bacterium]|nr:MAG: hypothetical protein D6730_02600 [Bacteroidota bacterium]
MAGKAFLIQAQKGSPPLPDLGIADHIRAMAFAAVNHRMLAFQFIAGQGMVKLLFVQMNHIELSSVVLAVAFKTFLPPNAHIGMIASVLPPQALNFIVAGQTFFAQYFGPDFMALGTVAEALQMGMGLGEVPRRQLPKERTHAAYQQTICK